MTSKAAAGSFAAGRHQIYVWVWLPAATEPVVAGVLTRSEQLLDGEHVLLFTYASSYRQRVESVSLFSPELPLGAGTFDPARPTGGRSALALHGCLRDAAPDAWGRRVINLRAAGDSDVDLDELTYLAESDSDRIGALDYQDSPTTYVPRGGPATLEQLMTAAELIEAGAELPADLQAAAGHGTSIGGATPKALLLDGDRQLVAKFASSTDIRPVIQAEAAATFLAARVGMQVSAGEVRTVAGKKVLLLERFDRGPGGQRRQMVTALTILGLSEHEARYSAYPHLAQAIRTGPWAGVKTTLTELFTRLVFNVCIGNTDDHLRNHAAFWDGSRLRLTPAYDVTPQPRSGQIATHAIALTRGGDRHSQLRLCRESAAEFQLSAPAAEGIIDNVVTTITRDWQQAADHAQLTRAQADSLMGREILNPYIFYSDP